MSPLEPAIIYEDNDLLVLNKPAGLVVHTDGRTEEATLVEWVLARYPTLADVGGLHTLDNERYVVRAGILHRLDRETSGIVLVAKHG
jgi:23S rRNA pseudouridine1911/1915/1917 synthase